MAKSINEIVSEFLENNTEYDGLVHTEVGCACLKGDLWPCECPDNANCVAGHLKPVHPGEYCENEPFEINGKKYLMYGGARPAGESGVL